MNKRFLILCLSMMALAAGPEPGGPPVLEPDEPPIIIPPPLPGKVSPTTDLTVVSYNMGTNAVTLGMTFPSGEYNPNFVQIRYSASAFNAAEWNAQQVVADVALSTIPGFALNQHLTMTVTVPDTLAGEVPYWFATRNMMVQGAGPTRNVVESPVSNIASKTTPDAMLPGVTTTLTLSHPTATSVEVAWNQMGDDDDSGAPTAFDLRCSSSGPSQFSTAEEWFSLAVTISTASVIPQGGNAPALVVVGGLQSGTTYYFAIKTVDEGGNESDLSQVISMPTLGQPVSPDTDDGSGQQSPCSGSACSGASSLVLVAAILAARVKR